MRKPLSKKRTPHAEAPHGGNACAFLWICSFHEPRERERCRCALPSYFTGARGRLNTSEDFSELGDSCTEHDQQHSKKSLNLQSLQSITKIASYHMGIIILVSTHPLESPSFPPSFTPSPLPSHWPLQSPPSSAPPSDASSSTSPSPPH